MWLKLAKRSAYIIGGGLTFWGASKLLNREKDAKSIKFKGEKKNNPTKTLDFKDLPVDDKYVAAYNYALKNSNPPDNEIKALANKALECEQFEVLNFLAQQYPHIVNTKTLETQLWESPKSNTFIFNILVKESEKNLAPALQDLQFFVMEDMQQFENYLSKVKKAKTTEPQYFVLQKHGLHDGNCVYGKIEPTDKHGFKVEFKGSHDIEDTETALESIKKYFPDIDHSSPPEKSYR